MPQQTILFFSIAFLAVQASFGQETITIDAQALTRPFPHFWEQIFGSGRAVLALRQSYRDDLVAVKGATELKYLRFHAIFHDENGVYNEDEHGNPVYNFAYVDEIYDGLVERGVRPFVEISFMPKKLAFNPDALHPFWYKQNVSPPKSMERWDGLITAFAKNLLERYGASEIAQWYFEVWNEPNIDFWGGVPQKKSYFELYAHTAHALKAVIPQFRVGGPATAAAQWVPDFLKFAADEKVAVDFVSTHGYADDTVENLFGTNEDISMDHRVCRAIAKVRGEIDASKNPKLPLFWTEWNVPGQNELRDTAYVGPALANTVSECDGKVDGMSFWTFSDVFEEGGPIPRPFEGHFGLRAEFGINKPSFYDFALLHRLGEARLPNPDGNIIVTKRKNGLIAAALWNLRPAEGGGAPKQFLLRFSGVAPNAPVLISRVDPQHSNTLEAYKALGSPTYPTPEQVKRINAATQLKPPEKQALAHGQITVDLQPDALILLELPAH